MPKKKHPGRVVGVAEHVRIAVELALKNFALSDQSEIEFPSSLSAKERAYIHQTVFKLGLKSKSRGKKANRSLTVYKREKSAIVQADASFQLCEKSREAIHGLLDKFPVTNRERQELLPETEKDRVVNPDLRDVNKALGRLPSGIAQIPSPPGPSTELKNFRQNLPIWPHKDEIIRTIFSNQVCIVQGQTGSGKTTQIPQFILEHSRLTNRPCRIIVTEPRRIAVVNVCERVCLERDEKMGHTVGYQIRLESRISPKTVLTFCTSGVLLRTLMCGESSLANVTHIIVDEVHERDKFCDFLLIALRDLLPKFRNLHLILMSATLDTDIFSKYFNNCPVVSVPGRLYPVKEFFLEDILKYTGYIENVMCRAEEDLVQKKSKKENLKQWEASLKSYTVAPSSTHQSEPDPAYVATEELMESNLQSEMDNVISQAFINGSEDAMSQMLHLILCENVSVDYQHSQTGMTALMVAASRNALSVLEQLLLLGANLWIRASNDNTALDWANFLKHEEAAEMIRNYCEQMGQQAQEETAIISKGELSEEDKNLLHLYHSSFNDDNIDVDLLLTLILQIHCTQPLGAILVFLAGYDDIVTVRERIIAEDKAFSDHMKYVIYTLHSNMQTGEQRKVFRPALFNVRKIILSTNIAETSLTIDDVIYVIDSGKMKEKSFDPLTGVSGLKTIWISQTCAEQRKGRAGRSQPGICYHLFSSVRYQAMQKHSTPEMLRVPLQELCLHSKLLAPANTPIAEFLSKALEPPPFLVTRNAVQHLKTIDALDSWEDLTELGVHLLDLPIEPRLGKMLMYGCILKCLDPVLTIVCCLAYRDPFVLPFQPNEKRALHGQRKKLAAGTFSDHMVLLRAFQSWQAPRTDRNSEQNYISGATMEMVTGTRAQLLAQLRASGFVRSRAPGDIRDLNTNSENWAVVKAALCAGLYPNLARVDREQNVLRTKKECRVIFHPSSTLREIPQNPNQTIAQILSASIETLPTDWIMFEELGRTGRICHIRTCTLISPITIALMSGPSRLPLDCIEEAEAYRPDGTLDLDSDSESEEKPNVHQSILKIDDWALFKVDTDVAHLTLQLRQKLHSMFLKRMKSPGRLWTPADEAVVKAVVGVLTAEETKLNLTQPQGIGQRPRPFNLDYLREEEFYSNNQNFFFGNTDQRPSRKSPVVPPSQQQTSQRNSQQNSQRNPRQQGEPSRLNGDKYFVIKVHNMKAFESAVAKEMWNFNSVTEKKLTRALQEARNVYLIFSIQGSKNFQGYCKMNPNGQPVTCSSQVPLLWLKRGNIPFTSTRHLKNPFNENQWVQSSRDGQELEPSIGASLCQLWDKPPPSPTRMVGNGNPNGHQSQNQNGNGNGNGNGYSYYDMSAPSTSQSFRGYHEHPPVYNNNNNNNNSRDALPKNKK